MNPVNIIHLGLTASLTASLTAGDITYKKVILCAKRNSGKSTLIASLVKSVRCYADVDHFAIISSDVNLNTMYKNEFNDVNIFHTLKEDYLDAVPEICERFKHVLMVLEDATSVVLADKKIQNKIHHIITIQNLTLFVVCQSCIFSCDIVKDFDMFIFGKENTYFQIERMFKYVKNICSVKKFILFNKIIMNLPNHSFIYIKNVNKHITKKLDPPIIRMINIDIDESDDGLLAITETKHIQCDQTECSDKCKSWKN
jgi:hypothetical protein